MNGLRKAKRAVHRPAILPAHYPQLAATLDNAAELIDRHGWWGARGVMTDPDRPLNALTAITRASLATVGESPFLFDHIEEAVTVLEATLDIDAGSLLEWNNSRSCGEVVTDALRLCATRLRYS